MDHPKEHGQVADRLGRAELCGPILQELLVYDDPFSQSVSADEADLVDQIENGVAYTSLALELERCIPTSYSFTMSNLFHSESNLLVPAEGFSYSLRSGYLCFLRTNPGRSGSGSQVFSKRSKY